MLQYLNQKRGQSTLEYAVLIVVIIGALLTIQVYLKRGYTGRIRQATDDIGDQYSDGNMNEVRTTNTFTNTEETFNEGNSTSNLFNEVTNAGTNSVMINTQQEYWGS